MTVKTKPRQTTRPVLPVSPQRYSNIVPKDDPVQCPAAKTAAEKFRKPPAVEIDEASRIMEAALRRQPNQSCPSAQPPQETWPQAFAGLFGPVWRSCKAAGRGLEWFFGLVGEAAICVSSFILSGACYGIAGLVFLLVIWKGLRPSGQLVDAAAGWISAHASRWL